MAFRKSKPWIIGPSPGVGIDWDDPLAQLLYAAVPFSDGAGNRPINATGRGNYGADTVSATPPTWTQGTRGPAGKFLDTSTTYWEWSKFPWPGGAISISMWINASTPGGSSANSAFTIGNLDDPQRCQAHLPYTDNKLYWDYANVGAGRLSTPFGSYLNKEVFLTLTSDSVSAMGIFVNAVQIASSGTAANPGALTGLWLGQWNGIGWLGRMQGVLIHNRVLKQSEIQTLYSQPWRPYITPKIGFRSTSGAPIVGAAPFLINWS